MDVRQQRIRSPEGLCISRDRVAVAGILQNHAITIGVRERSGDLRLHMSFVPEFLLKPLRPYLRAILDTRGHAALTSNVLYAMQRELLLSNERIRDPKRLLAHGFRGYSQHDEDGMIQETFERIGVSKQVFLEFGVGDGSENNTLYLMMSGWRGLWIEGSEPNAATIRNQMSSFIQTGQLSFVHGFVDRDSINEFINKAGYSGEIDLLSIDIDGNDYWVWEVISVVQPRVVVIEYNAVFRPPLSIVAEYKKNFVWNGTSYYGASLKALESLGSRKGYALVGCSLSGINAFFVKQGLVGDRFCAPFTAENHFEPPRFGFYKIGALDMHPPGAGRYEVV
jgi:hypothetical protein